MSIAACRSEMTVEVPNVAQETPTVVFWLAGVPKSAVPAVPPMPPSEMVRMPSVRTSPQAISSRLSTSPVSRCESL
jgi:hypothetical protein